MTNKLKELNEKLGELKKLRGNAEKELFESNEYKSLFGDEKKNDEEISELNRNMNILNRDIERKYYKKVSHFTGKDYGNIKASILQGIKKGLGIKYLKETNNDIFVKITKKMLDEDRDNNQQIRESRKKWEELNDKGNHISYKMSELRKKKIEGINGRIKVIEGGIILEKQKEQQEKQKIEQEFDRNSKEYMDKIKKEVGKRLLLDNLE